MYDLLPVFLGVGVGQAGRCDLLPVFLGVGVGQAFAVGFVARVFECGCGAGNKLYDLLSLGVGVRQDLLLVFLGVGVGQAIRCTICCLCCWVWMWGRQ